MKATGVQTVAFGVKCNHTSALCRGPTICLGTAVWAHSWAHTARFSLGLFRIRKETARGDGFFDRGLGCPRNQSPSRVRSFSIVAWQLTRGSQPVPRVDDEVTAWRRGSSVARRRGSQLETLITAWSCALSSAPRRRPRTLTADSRDHLGKFMRRCRAA